MRSLAVQLATVAIVLSGALTHSAVAQEGDARAALLDTLAKAQACRTEFGGEWDAIVSDALFNLEGFLVDEDPTIPKVDLDVILAEALADGKEMPVTEDLRAHCRQVMASGS